MKEDINKIIQSKTKENLLTSSDVGDMLNLSRERIRQLINDKVLPIKYIFNKNSKRRQYIFEKTTVEEFVKNGKVDWYETEDINLLSIPEINTLLDCPTNWAYDMTREGKLEPSIVIGSVNRRIFLYDIMSVQIAYMNKSKRGSEKGYKKSTLELIENIKALHKTGLNDSEIAKKLDKKQPFIAKLRKDIGLDSHGSRGRPKKYIVKELDTVGFEGG
jgi:hypothetical protein